MPGFSAKGKTLDPAIQRVENALTHLASHMQRVQLYRDKGSQLLDRSSYTLLKQLYHSGPQRLSALAAALGLDLSTVSRQVRGLEDDGLIVRERDPADRRASILGLTEAGSTAMRRTRAVRRGLLRSVLRSWPENDVTTFAALLERLDADWNSTDLSAEVLTQDIDDTSTEETKG